MRGNTENRTPHRCAARPLRAEYATSVKHSEDNESLAWQVRECRLRTPSFLTQEVLTALFIRASPKMCIGIVIVSDDERRKCLLWVS